MRGLGGILVAVGVVLVVAGALAWAGWLSWFGNLPGDLRYEGERTRVYVPITSMVLISVVLTLVVSLLRRWM